MKLQTDPQKRTGWRRLGEIAAVVPVFAGFFWAILEALFALLVVTADDFPQCSDMQPDKAALVILTLVIAAAALGSFVMLVQRRPLAACGCVVIQIPLAFAWAAIDGGAAGCLIG